jgi:hypothetical protein
MNIHVMGSNGEAKFWMEPVIELAQNYGLSQREIGDTLRMIQEHENDIHDAWQRHFGG